MVGVKSSNAEILNQLKEKVALGCRIIAQQNLSDYLGHVSARVPETDYVLIKARGLDTGNLLNMTANKVLVVDLEGKLVQGDYTPPDETELHTEIYKVRPDVHSVVHTHQEITTAFGDTGKKILPIQGVMAGVLADDIPVFESSRKIVTTEQGAAVAKTLGQSSILHLRNHGIVSVADSVERAVIHAIWLEAQARLTMYASIIGTPRGMSQEELELQLTDAGPMESRWRYYVSLLENN